MHVNDGPRQDMQHLLLDIGSSKCSLLCSLVVTVCKELEMTRDVSVILAIGETTNAGFAQSVPSYRQRYY